MNRKSILLLNSGYEKLKEQCLYVILYCCSSFHGHCQLWVQIVFQNEFMVLKVRMYSNVLASNKTLRTKYVIEYRKDWKKLVQLILVCPTSHQIRTLFNIFDRCIDRGVRWLFIIYIVFHSTLYYKCFKMHRRIIICVHNDFYQMVK